jgi:hypothetical protein
VRGRLGYSGGEVAEAGARVNGEAMGQAVVGGERTGDGMGGTRDLTSEPGLPAGERREREWEGAANRWGQVVRQRGRAQLGHLGHGRRGGKRARARARARFGPDTAQPRGEGFFLFLFLFSISHFHFLFFCFFLFPFLLNQQFAKKF